ncbi:MAG TPA: hypothetical protein PLJ23_00820 [Gemmatimonadales bacterium]|jgi:hypothetical protein|nr:hypothetical protein [Gemmatimonadales bacterium]
MNEQLRDRIARRLEALPDERGLQILDYVEFLESKYAERSTPTNIFARLSDTVQDTMRAGKLPLEAISGTVGFFDGASKVMRGIASAATAVVDEASKTAEQLAKSGAKDPAPPAAPPAAPTPPADPPG